MARGRGYFNLDLNNKPVAQITHSLRYIQTFMMQMRRFYWVVIWRA